MCGIAGIVSRSSWIGNERAGQLCAMLHALRHRGPDSQGSWQDNDGIATLGHRRLAIIDLSPAGAQPMHEPRTGRTLTFNGEIYNYLELRRELEAAGIRFVGRSDTEVLLRALCHWGLEEALARLVGMFAFALWDARERKLRLVRDRLGKKPLYYCLHDDRFYFASEIKAFRCLPGLSLQCNRAAIFHYLSLGFVPAPQTAYRDLFQVMPGGLVELDADFRLHSYSYWNLPSRPRRVISVAQAAAELQGLLDQAVTCRLQSDVPVGVFLSGGIDSGLVTALATRHRNRAIHSFTVAFDSSAFDESALARQVAQRCGTVHHEFRLSYRLEDLLPDVVRVYDEPFGDPSAFPSLLISRHAAQFVKVVLNGDGGDEVFGGYRRHRAAKLFGRLASLGGDFAVELLRAARAALPHPAGIRTRYSFVHRLASGLEPNPFTRYLIWGTSGFQDADKRWLLQDQGIDLPPTETLLASRFVQLEQVSPLDHLMALDLLLGLPDGLLVKMDRASMAFGLEARSPFLDHRIIEWAAGIDSRCLLAGAPTKPILRAMARDYLPPNVVGAPKRGFEPPLSQWIRRNLRGIVSDICMAQRGLLLELCDRARLRAVLNGERASNEATGNAQVWLLLMLAAWDCYARESSPAMHAA